MRRSKLLSFDTDIGVDIEGAVSSSSSSNAAGHTDN